VTAPFSFQLRRPVCVTNTGTQPELGRAGNCDEFEEVFDEFELSDSLVSCLRDDATWSIEGVENKFVIKDDKIATKILEGMRRGR
jgi:hypothetical protein